MLKNLGSEQTEMYMKVAILLCIKKGLGRNFD